jgi:glucosamine kinase
LETALIPDETDQLFFCVDGGGTRCRGRLYDREGKILAQAMGGPCNPATDLQLAVASVAAVWSDCAAAIGRAADQRDGVVFAVGSAGTFLDGGKTLLAACPPFPKHCAMSDGYAALIGAGGGAPASLLIVGTGVAGHRLFPNGASIQRDAWGWVVGDRGSGSWMGQRALRHLFATFDGVAPPDALSRAVLDAIGGVARIRLGWTRDLGPDRLGALAPVVIAAANAGDPVAQRIRERAAEHLAALLGVIADAETPCYAAGGLAGPMRSLLQQKTEVPILEPKGDALNGCWLVAMGRAPVERMLLFGENPEPKS